MDDLAREIAAIRDGLSPEWDEARSERLFAGVGRLQRRRRRHKAAAASLLAGGALAVMFAWNAVPRSEHAGALAGRNVPAAPADARSSSHPPALAARVEARQRVRLADGSSAVVVSRSGSLDVLRNDPRHLELALHAGRAHFDVVPNANRRFVVSAGPVRIAVVGTIFEVERTAERVRVAVSEGKVRVETPAGDQFVAMGESAWFDALGARVTSAPNEAEASTPAHDSDHFKESAARGADPASDPSPPREPVVKSKRLAREDKAVTKVSWRSLCQSGDYEEAYRLIESGTPVEDEPAALMDAADAARLSNHPEASVQYLRRVLRDHTASPVAPLAGFTLGRVLLERLGQPREAAEAFALSRSIAPQGSLAQDALAREVEAWSKAGNGPEAYQRAQLYVQLYPAGRRLRAVRLYGGLD